MNSTVDQATGRPADAVPAPGAPELLDDRQEWAAFGRPCTPNGASAGGESAWESHVVIEGMHCAACALTIEEALCAVPGVAQAEVSASSAAIAGQAVFIGSLPEDYGSGASCCAGTVREK